MILKACLRASRRLPSVFRAHTRSERRSRGRCQKIMDKLGGMVYHDLICAICALEGRGDMAKEAKARILINDLLGRSGWRFFDDDNGPANITLEANVKLKKKTLDALGDDFESTANGYVDYLLLDERGFPIAVLEAKSEKFDPLVGKSKPGATPTPRMSGSSSCPTETFITSGTWSKATPR